MAAHIFTTSTRIQVTDEFKKYYEEFIMEYNRVYREMWNIVRNNNFKSSSSLVSEMCSKHNMLKRTINSIFYDVRGRLNSLKALKKTELEQLEIRISKKEEKVEKIIKNIEILKPSAIENRLSKKNLQKYRMYKQSLYYQKNALNRLKQKRNNLIYCIEHNIYKIGFGSKKMFSNQYRLNENGYKSHEGWYNQYKRCRDRNVFYLGSRDESFQNQMFQLKYELQSDDFTIQIRKEKEYSDNGKYLILEHVDFKYLKENIISILNNRDQPLSFRIHRKGNKWYLQCMFEIKEQPSFTSYTEGTIGLDYNDGFIELSETDTSGNLIFQKHFELKYHGCGNKAENEIRTVIHHIVQISLEKGKNIIVEDLDFKRTKSRTQKGKTKKGRNYNRMLHRFDYSRYKETLINCAHRNGSTVEFVDPRNTSRIGKEKYGYTKKLNVHQAASYVIARKGQKYKD